MHTREEILIWIRDSRFGLYHELRAMYRSIIEHVLLEETTLSEAEAQRYQHLTRDIPLYEY